MISLEIRDATASNTVKILHVMMNHFGINNNLVTGCFDVFLLHQSQSCRHITEEQILCYVVVSLHNIQAAQNDETNQSLPSILRAPVGRIAKREAILVSCRSMGSPLSPLHQVHVLSQEKLPCGPHPLIQQAIPLAVQGKWRCSKKETNSHLKGRLPQPLKAG